MPHWSGTTVAKLRSIVFSMLADVGYLESTRSLRLQNVFIDELFDKAAARASMNKTEIFELQIAPSFGSKNVQQFGAARCLKLALRRPQVAPRPKTPPDS